MKLKIQKNEKLQIKKVRMNRDNRPPKLNPALQWNFCSMIVGGPGSGKTNLWMNLLCNKSKHGYYRKFHKIYLFSPSLHTIEKRIDLPEDQMISQFTMEALQKAIDSIADDENALFVLDDVASHLKPNMSEMLKLVWNRRHTGAGSSVMIITQKYNAIPLQLRSACSSVFMFNKAKKELVDLYDEFSGLEKSTFVEISRVALSKKHQFLYMKLDEDEMNKYYRNFDKMKIEFSDDTEE